MKQIGRGCFAFETHPHILGYAAAVGSKEAQGPLGKCFDQTFEDNLLGEDSWEKAESRLVTEAVTTCLGKSFTDASQIDIIFTGDLLNQCIASTFGLRNLGVPHVGMYGACSTMASSLIAASVFVASSAAKKAVAVTSSHFSSSERQFRNPLQYGGQRTPTSQWTVTGAGAVLLGDECSKEHSNTSSAGICITAATVGTIEDLGITDTNNMGAAMAPVDVKLTP